MSHKGGWSRGSSSGRSESRSSDTRASNTGGDVVDSNHARTADIVRKKLKVENGNLVESNAISRQSTLIFKQLIHKDGDTWLHIPNDHKLRYFKEFKLKEGTPASQLNFAVFHKLHCQNGVYDNEKSACIGATIIRQRNELSQQTSESSESGEVDTNDITVGAAGGVSKKGRLYGLGSQGNVYIAASSSKSLTRPTSETALRQRIADLEAKLNTQEADSQAQLEAQTQKYEALQARIDAQEANLQKKFESMFATFMASSRHPTSP